MQGDLWEEDQEGRLCLLVRVVKKTGIRPPGGGSGRRHPPHSCPPTEKSLGQRGPRGGRAFTWGLGLFRPLFLPPGPCVLL